jgi:hypothetical protein
MIDTCTQLVSSITSESGQGNAYVIKFDTLSGVCSISKPLKVGYPENQILDTMADLYESKLC